VANSPICSIENCNNRHHARGLCYRHYKEQWLAKCLNAFPRRLPVYQMSTHEFIRTVAMAHGGNECLPWPYAQSRGDHGYGVACIDRKTRTASRVVCELRHGPAPTPAHEAAHTCHQGYTIGCVNPNHLEWQTKEENIAERSTQASARSG
jgi:hypothetical protein